MRLIERVWFYRDNARYWLVPLLLPLTLIFALLTRFRRWCYRIGLKKTQQLSEPVIVVGNIGVGGNGKTPVTLSLIELAKQCGYRPGVISRGYGGKAPHYPYLLTSESTAVESGDESYLIYQRAQVPVCVGSDRIAAGNKLIELGCNLIIADDGLQHYRLARQCELIVVDAKRMLGNGLLLPAGPLREGKARLQKADLVIFNGVETLATEQLNLLNSVDGRYLLERTITMRLAATKVVNLASKQVMSVSEFTKRFSSVNAIAGIGDPARFFTTLTTIGLDCQHSRGFVDHHHFQASDFADYDDNIPLLMTEKDAVKCQGFAKDNYWYLTVDADFEPSAQEKLTSLLVKLNIGK
ncbi:tetraacyldisaccharide 4'-kinase [Endozoicomonas sp. G2_1]|uniref:tetraacyldisaccharide 4'-kinase n=1 Tax=Endozoicomonas sp. G2_1 TaxID=2821091 RepID=UPI001ADB49F7|nr:tetraacyldisaccharide 4'-kinase [Endozoicomonas sp. G2_1]MBO9489015.1 tetraacyldisaccharide 4'-kinase [Endozoicomonas sp. G2_1]